MTMNDLQPLLPVIVVIGTALLVLLMDAFMKKGRGGVIMQTVTVLGIMAAVVLSISGFSSPSGLLVFSGSIRVDLLGNVANIMILSAGMLAILLSGEYLMRRESCFGEYYGIFLLSIAGMMLFCSANDLITIFLSLELMSICLYILTGITRRDPRSNEASVKYLILGAFATGFLLYGMALIYGATGTIYLNDLATIGIAKSPVMLIVGITLALVGFAFKLGAAPFHMWVPDVYEGAPTPVTAFMAVAVKAAGFIVLMRFVVSMDEPIVGEMLWGIAALTMIVGNVLALVQGSVKRMLAYSSVAHTGYAMIGLTCWVSTHNSMALTVSLYYLLVYLFMTLGAFAMILFTGKGGKECERYEDYEGLAWRSPWKAAAMSLFMISLAGIPPTAGFMGKFGLFKVALDGGHTTLVLIAIGTTVISLYYYLRVVVMMYMKPGAEPVEDISGQRPASFESGIVIFLASIFTITFGLLPSSYLELASKSIRILLENLNKI